MNYIYVAAACVVLEIASLLTGAIFIGTGQRRGVVFMVAGIAFYLAAVAFGQLAMRV